MLSPYLARKVLEEKVRDSLRDLHGVAIGDRTLRRAQVQVRAVMQKALEEGFLREMLSVEVSFDPVDGSLHVNWPPPPEEN